MDVRSDLEHVLSSLRRPSVDSKAVVIMVDGAPILQVGLERRLNLPVLDQVLDQVRETASRMRGLLSWCTMSAAEPRLLRIMNTKGCVPCRTEVASVLTAECRTSTA
jgi:hypothetical protein